MRKLRKAEIEALDEHIELVRSAGFQLHEAIQQYNTAAGPTNALEELVEGYNTAVSAAEEFRQSVHELQEAHWYAKLDQWQESEAGAAYEDWMGCWETELPTLDPDFLEEGAPLDLPDLDALQSLEELPQEP